ncbi:MAG TPA: hypothetical protein VNZ45_05150 [Bacteroidia bacterium]|jgi:hypothetical protein|nr:hypothetical protein [Bacteroidia bacterium]
MDGTILGQGTFTAAFSAANPNTGVASIAAANNQVIQIPSNADWMRVYNYTKAGANGSNAAYVGATSGSFVGVEYIWQRGMAAGTGIVKYKTNSSSAMNEDTMVAGGFTLWDPSGQAAGALPLVGNTVAIQRVQSSTTPTITTASTTGLVASTSTSLGSIVMLTGVSAVQDICGIPFVISTVTANTSFLLGISGVNALATAPGVGSGTSPYSATIGYYKVVNYQALYYPRKRYVVQITQATNAQVSTSIPHALTVGQEVRFHIPTASSMIQLNATSQNNYQSAIVTGVVDLFNFTINIDTTGFTAFTWPTSSPNQMPSDFPTVVPFGEDTATALSTPGSSTNIQVPNDGFGNPVFSANTGILADATVNTGYLGMLLGQGGLLTAASTTPITGPSGTVNFNSSNVITSYDTVYWVAGKSSFGGL